MTGEQPDVMGTYIEWAEPVTDEILELLRDLDRLHAGGLDRDEWMARKRSLIERIEPGFYARKGER